jgi:long-subunit fatty acid transport protein
MKRILGTAAALAAAATTAQAGGIERSTQSVAILFEQGSYAELGFGYLSPDVSGTQGNTIGPFQAGTPSGDMLPSYTTYSLGYKTDLNEDLSLAIILDEPIGADVDYPGTFGTPGSYALAGTTAELNSTALTAFLKYKFENNVSLYGGLRYETVQGDVSIPLVGAPQGYDLSTNTDGQWGYVVGVAWEKPEIGARVALTYNSAITHTLDSDETLGPLALDSSFETEVPQSVNLEFQTGIAEDTLLFGSIRWVDWSEFDIAPPLYTSVVGTPLVNYAEDRVTYNLGIGRKFSEQWSGAASIGYEAADGQLTGNLGPYDGFTSFALAATYTMDQVKVSAGVRYFDIGDATTNPPVSGRFTNNSAVGFGLRVGYSF